MTNPRNRTRTPGAFGKYRGAVPAPASFRVNRRPAAAGNATGDAAAPAFNISNALIHFARPVIDQAGKNRVALKGAMNVAILLWNAAVEGPAAVAAARKTLLSLPSADPEQVAEIVDAMVARKEELYPNVRQVINDYSLTFNRRNALVRVVPFNLEPAGVEKSGIAGLLGPLVVPRERPSTVDADAPPPELPPENDGAPAAGDADAPPPASKQ
ncbi:MAG: hypothetical protein LBR07_04780 [Puniceicoccales bacterium]|jgi:hypothetical protein|nr:hypothetical protein [Puniceicoccales bacterium]